MLAYYFTGCRRRHAAGSNMAPHSDTHNSAAAASALIFLRHDADDADIDAARARMLPIPAMTRHAARYTGRTGYDAMSPVSAAPLSAELFRCYAP